ncbi:MAG TPA: hypothetical protein DDY98_03575 [Ruminococcaceae bacterium]|nr:hypothetical protein [Oscillospiraceae bacterium]
MKTQKILSFFFAVLFMFSVFSVSVHAEGIGACTHMAHGRSQSQICTAAVNACVPIVRDEVNWWTVEPVKNQLSMPERASWNKSATDKGIKCLVVLSYGNPIYDFGQASQADLDAGGSWDCIMPVRDGNPETTADDEYFDAYVRYVDFVSKSLAGKVEAYEIWNEPDIKGFNTKEATGADYAELLKAAYQTIKHNDPNVTVLGGSIALHTDFIDAMMKAGAGKYMDGLSVHYYLSKNAPEKQARKRLDKYRDVLVKYGYGKMPVWLTETGWANCYVDELTQAQYIVRNAVLYDEFLLDYGIEGRYFTYELQDSSITSSDLNVQNYENSLGLYKNDFTPKKSAGAVKTFNSMTAGKKLTAIKQTRYGLFYQKSAYAATYSQSGQTAYVVWAESQMDLEITLPDAPFTIYDMQGNIIEKDVQGGVKQIGASPSPIYLVFDSDSASIEQNPMQKVIAFFRYIFRVLANGFVGW